MIRVSCGGQTLVFSEWWKTTPRAWPCAAELNRAHASLRSTVPLYVPFAVSQHGRLVVKHLFLLHEEADLVRRGPWSLVVNTGFLLLVRFWPWDAGELLREPCGGRVWEDDEPSLLGQVQALDPLEDLPWDDPLAPGCRAGLRHPHPDPHQMAVKLGRVPLGLIPAGPCPSPCCVLLSVFPGRERSCQSVSTAMAVEQRAFSEDSSPGNFRNFRPRNVGLWY